MQIFEFHFNPKHNEDRLFDTFVYEPENTYEKSLGSLYMIGELTSPNAQNSKLLNDISSVIKKKYYNFSYKNPEKALTEALKKTNVHLGEELKKEDINWLGNLNFGALAIKDKTLSFSETGNLKILLMRGGEITDIAHNLNLQEIDPYPLKIFFNIVSGKLAPGDKILVLTKDAFDYLEEQKLIAKINRAKELDKRSLKRLFPASLFTKEDGEKISGACLLITIGNGETAHLKAEKEIIKEMPRQRKLTDLLSPAFTAIANFKDKTFELLKRKEKVKLIETPKIEDDEPIETPEIPKVNPALVFLGNVKNFSSNQSKKILEAISAKIPSQIGFKKIMGLMAILLIVLVSGFLIFKKSDNSKMPATAVVAIEEIKEEKQIDLVNSENISEPKKIEANLSEAGSPSKMIITGDSLYFFSPDSNKIYYFNKTENKGKVIEAEKEIQLADSPDGVVIFFAKPDTIFLAKNGALEKATISPDASSFVSLSTYYQNLYFLNQNKSVIKYSYVSGLDWDPPQEWTKQKPDNQLLAKSFSVEESLWMLNSDNSIDKYYKGNYVETIHLDLSIAPENLTKIITKAGNPNIYLLETVNRRVIITDKTGHVLKQYRSDKFGDIKDMAVSTDGKTIYLLSGLDVYEINM